MTWTIYAIVVDGCREYIGHAKDMRMRAAGHRGDMFYGVAFEVEELAQSRTKSGAVRVEARMIRKHRPPRNIQFAGPRPYELVRTIRWNGHDRWLECSFRLFPGVMHPDRAREVWHGSPAHLHSGAVIKGMPGWTRPRATYMFGPRQSHKNGNNADNRLSNLAWETPSDNNQRKREHGTAMIGVKNVQGRKTHCPSGHPYDDKNTRLANGKRICRACARESMRRRRAAGN